MRLQQKMELVWHQTKKCQRHRDFLINLPHQVYKRGEAITLVKIVTEAIAPIQNTVNKPTS
jgi:hypothetical protein